MGVEPVFNLQEHKIQHLTKGEEYEREKIMS